MKKKKGFIQISILVAIIAGILILGGGSYFGVKQYQNHQTEKIEKEKEVMVNAGVEARQRTLEEAQQQKDLEVEKLKQEVEILKKQSSKIATKEVTTQSDKLPQSLLDEILQRTVKITCTSSTLKSQGSGSIVISSEDSNDWFVFTNTHVVLVGPPEDNNCVVGVPSKPNYSVNNNFDGKIVDVNEKFPLIDKTVLLVTGDRGFKHLVNDIIPACKFSDIKIGDKVTIVGYPAFGGSSLTATEGIVSGFEETKYGPIYKTSAKIDSGNSGGTAVDNTRKCLLGMPTWATQGTFEGLGYIQSWEMINNGN